jgi:hypothetical protein
MMQVADVALRDVRVDGSLLVHADCVMGGLEKPYEAAARSRHLSNDIYISHPDGSQTIYSGAPHAQHNHQSAGSSGNSSSVVPFYRGDSSDSQRLVFSER